MTAETDDREIVAKVLAGDREAFAALVDKYQSRVFNGLLRMAGNRHDAEDLTQETFFRAYAALESYRSEYEFSTWLFRIAHNLFLNHRRKSQREGHREVPSGSSSLMLDLTSDPAPLPDQLAERDDSRTRLWRVVSSLPFHLSEVVVLRHVEDFSYREIATITGVPVGTVKSRLSRARRDIARRLEQAPETSIREGHPGPRDG